MENCARIIRKEDKTNNMSEKMDNNNSAWDADKSISCDELNELGCEVLNKNDAPERKKRHRSIVRPEDVAYNDLTAAEAKDFEETHKAKYLKPENFLYRQISKPTIIPKDGFSCLSDEIILGVFKYLSHEDLKYVAQVNQRFRRLSNDECLWPRIDLANKIISSNSLAYILKKGVKVLRLKEATIKSPIWDEAVGETLQDFTSRLELLDLGYSVASSKDIALFLSKCRNLRKLSLESCEMTLDVCKEVAENRLLDTLNLAMSVGLEPQGVKIICTNCQRIQHLNLAWTHLSKESIHIVVNDIYKNLQSVNLSGLGFSVVNNSIKTLIRRCPRLVELDISDCVDVTSSIIPEIAEFLPNLKSLAISRCYKIDPKIVIYNLAKTLNLISLTAFRVIGSVEAKDLENKYSLLRVNKDYFSAIARPTVGVRRTSIWLVRCRE